MSTFIVTGNCKNVSLGLECEVGLRLKTYNVLTGSVLSVWTSVEGVLTQDGQRKGQHGKMQVSLYYWSLCTSRLLGKFCCRW